MQRANPSKMWLAIRIHAECPLFDASVVNCAQGSLTRSFYEINLAPKISGKEGYCQAIRGQKVGYGMVVDGIAKFQALKLTTFQGLKFGDQIPCFAAQRENPSEISGPEIPKFRA